MVKRTVEETPDFHFCEHGATEVFMEVPVDCLDGGHVAELHGIISGGFQSVEGCIGFLAETDGVRAVVVDDLQEFISFFVERKELHKLRIIIVGFDHCLNGAEPAFFITIEFRGEVFVHMVFKLGKSTLIAEIPHEIVFGAVFELNLVVKVEFPLNSGDCF